MQKRRGRKRENDPRTEDYYKANGKATVTIRETSVPNESSLEVVKVNDVSFKKPRKQPVAKKSTKKQRPNVPSYPTHEYTPVALDTKQPKELVVKKLMSSILDQQCTELRKAYANKFPFLVDSVQDMTNSFTGGLTEVVLSKSSDDTKSPNPTNDAMQEESERLRFWNERMQTQIHEWETLGKRIAADKKKPSDSTVSLSKAESDTLHENCEGKIGHAVSSAYRTTSLKGESILTCLRDISQTLTRAKDIQTNLAEKLSRAALQPFSASPRLIVPGKAKTGATRKEA